ncbi:hypothetical protein [Segeticoccus rhizosphaerae]|jgi:hypothetical protein|uniref:hypothetical protein n=1 Tax=Segeticoccus rhizosphaerae TaxID=1104777 RepID=UPI0010BF7E5D|nr:hypothetical protein [Ornithinicoccus soli]
MSTRFAVRAERPAERDLFARLVDDAAVFPPGLAPLDRAVAEHLARQDHPHADLVGPLLVPASAAGDLVELERPGPLRVGLIARPGTPHQVVVDALATLQDVRDLEVTGVEIGWSPDWEEALAWDLPLSVEVPRETTARTRALAQLRAAQGESVRLQAKFRTGSTPHQPVPTAEELASFIRDCLDLDLSFKLTGGLHHVLAHTTEDGEEQHGLLGVLAATRFAIDGGDVDELASLVSSRDPAGLLDIITGMSDAEASVVRGFFTAYGCCGVLDPIGELDELGLLTATR